MHPVENLRGTASQHLAGRTIVLAVAGSIAAVKAVEVARELIRHGAEVVPVLSDAATRIIHPDALEFATGNKPIVRLTGQVEHVALLGDVPGRADLLLVAPATANTVAKMAMGIDDTPVTTCATVAFGSGVPVLVAPAMHAVMEDHPAMAGHRRVLESFGATWVDPVHEEKKAKLADPESIAEEVMHRLGDQYRGRRALVVAGATAERVDAVRILTNRSSGRTGHEIARELYRCGADVKVWLGRTTEPAPRHLEACTVRFSDHAELMALAKNEVVDHDFIFMPAAIADYVPHAVAGKLPSGNASIDIRLSPVGKVIEVLRRRAPRATLVAFKAEAGGRDLAARAKERMRRYNADFVVANTADAFGSATTEVTVHGPGKAKRLKGSKEAVMAALVRHVGGKE